MSASGKVRLLAEFDRSGLSSAAFARQHGIAYTTFCNWRYRRSDAKASPAFVQVELPTPTAPSTELVIELGSRARLRVTSEAQIPLVASLLENLNTLPSC